MYVLVTYDVATSEVGGQRRLRRVAKICTQYGQRVQFSVFECLVDPSQFETLKHALSAEIDADKDSLRFYKLGKNWKPHVEQIGVNTAYDPEGPLIL